MQFTFGDKREVFLLGESTCEQKREYARGEKQQQLTHNIYYKMNIYSVDDLVYLKTMDGVSAKKYPKNFHIT